MARKKIVFVIVEGPSDDEALGAIFSRAFDKNAVYVEVMHGDITSVKGNHSRNIVGKVGEFLQFLCESDFSVNTGYRESWDFIEEGLHSLERHSNLGLCFKEILLK